MVKAKVEVEGAEEPSKRAVISLDTFKAKQLEDFVTKRSISLLNKMQIPTSFLQVDPEMWPANDDFVTSMEIVQAMKVINDHEERGVALVQEFSGLLMHDEDQLQLLLQVVAEHRRAFPDSRKQTHTGQRPA